MGRWDPDAATRLRDAALDLFHEQGFDATNVSDIAQRAGLTERTFYRHYPDKREVLFQGQERLATVLREQIAAGDPDRSWLDLGADALLALGEFFSEERRPFSRRRQAVIDTEAGLREREQLKMAMLGDVIAEAIGDRGAPPAIARLAGETTIALLKVAFAGWVSPAETRSFPDLVGATLRELRSA